MLWSMPTIVSGLMFSVILLDKSVNNLTSTAGGTVRSVSGGDNATNKDDRIVGSRMVNMYGDDVTTVVSRTSVVGD